MGAKNGIIVRNRLTLEKLRSVDTILFDKTGTLTEGRLGVVAYQTASGQDQEAALALAPAAFLYLSGMRASAFVTLPIGAIDQVWLIRVNSNP